MTKIKYLGPEPVRLFRIDMKVNETYEVPANENELQKFVKTGEIEIIGGKKNVQEEKPEKPKKSKPKKGGKKEE